MSFNRHARRRDGNHREIVELLKRHGVTVHEIERPVDLLCGYRSRWFTVEIKNRKGRDRETPGQEQFRRECAAAGLPHFVLREGEAVTGVLDQLVKGWRTEIRETYSARNTPAAG